MERIKITNDDILSLCHTLKCDFNTVPSVKYKSDIETICLDFDSSGNVQGDYIPNPNNDSFWSAMNFIFENNAFPLEEFLIEVPFKKQLWGNESISGVAFLKRKSNRFLFSRISRGIWLGTNVNACGEAMFTWEFGWDNGFWTECCPEQSLLFKQLIKSTTEENADEIMSDIICDEGNVAFSIAMLMLNLVREIKLSTPMDAGKIGKHQRKQLFKRLKAIRTVKEAYSPLGHHKSPSHEFGVRGHWRRYKTGKAVFIKPQIRCKGKGARIEHEYVLGGAQ